MPRRRILADEQLAELLALPTTEPVLIQHWMLSPTDLAAVERRRGDPNQLGFALQLCAFRYPGRLLRLNEAVPAPALRFVAEQLGIAPQALADYAGRGQTRREQLDALRAAFGFCTFAPEHKRELMAWLLPVALGHADAVAIAATLMDELRRRKIIAPGPSTIERLVVAASRLAERQVGPIPTVTLVANSPADQAAGWSAAKRETRVLATEMPANHSATRTKLMATAVITCWRCVLAKPM